MMDVVVVGAGPAGSAAAARLSGEGWTVLLLDRAHFPRKKACGECVNPGGVSALARLGLLDEVMARNPALLRGWSIRSHQGTRAEGHFAPGAGPGFGITREVLDQVLADGAVSRGARFEEGARVTGVVPGSGGHPARVTFVSGRHARVREVEARVVVAADGLRSTLARRLDTVARRPRLRKLSLTCRVEGSGPPRNQGILVLGPNHTVGVAPVHAREPLWNVTVVVDPARHGPAVQADPREFLRRALNDAGLPWEAPPGILGEALASGPFDWPSSRGGVGRVLFAGDAAGYYDPLTGQGIFRALRSAELAAGEATRVLRGECAPEEAARRHTAALRHTFGPGRRVQRIVEAVVSSSLSRNLVLGRLGARGRMDALIRVTGDAVPVRSLLDPALWLPLPGRPPNDSIRSSDDHR